MIGSARGRQGISATQQRLHQVTRYPAPAGGIDVRQAIGNEALDTCVYTYNLVPFEFGMRVRKGYREWQKDLTVGLSQGVNTVMPYQGSPQDNSADRLFAVTNEGIWDVTADEGTPSLEYTFNTVDPDAGFGTFIQYVADSGANLLFYADNVNGVFQYSPDTGLWTIPAITGVDVTNLDSVVSHKQRIWFTERGSTTAWYLSVGAIAGAATPFFFGSKFQHGGALAGLFNWTVDGGEGVDDYLVAVSRSGDVLPYKGTDPTGEDWEIRGTYYIGEIPNAANFGTEQGGELFLLSVYGVISMSDLLSGVDTTATLINAEGTSTSLKIAGLLRQDMQVKLTQRGWGISNLPSEGGLLISTPFENNEQPIQYYFNVATQGWGLWRDVPIVSFSAGINSVIIGTKDNRVCIMDVAVDNKLIDPVNPATNGDDIQFSILTAFSSLGAEGVYKRVKILRPDFLAREAPDYSIQARYDYDIAEAANFQLVAPPSVTSGVWDLSSWDAAYWGGSVDAAFSSVGGAWGSGRYVAIAMIGKTRTDTRLAGWDLVFDSGGVMY